MNRILIVCSGFLYTLMKSNELLTQFGFIEHNSKEAKTGYLVNFSKTLKNDEIYYELYFMNTTEKYRCTVRFYPSFILEAIENENALELLKRQYSKEIHRIEIIEKIDLKVKNHLNLPPKKYLRVYCISETGYNHVVDGIRQSLKRSKMDKIVNIKKVNDKTIITESKEKSDLFDVYKDVFNTQQKHATLESYIIQMHECDIPFDILFACENNIRCGKYYTTRYNEDACHITECENSLPPELSFVAFDIETSKEPLKFPSSDIDQIMMISLVTENSGMLIINKNFVKQDVYNFDYHIGSSNKGLGIQIVECNNEEFLLLALLEQIYKIQPIILTTYNGDSFDIPYIKDRMKKYNIEYTLDNLIHLDCYKWVKRDSYLPMGSQGLKAVAKIKLGYVPDEVDPEEMVHLAEFESMKMASYSVSDSVATYELYKKYIHPFVYSLCTLIPIPPYDVLSKGSGTLCESLLIAEAINAKILIPPKRIENVYNYEGHICNEVSYVGGHVECLRSGIFRSDFEYTFTLKKKDIDYVKNKYLSMNMNLADTEAKDLIVKQFDGILDSFRSTDSITVSCKPLIYHLDVGAMYPNIILTNRLQPMGIVGQNTCVNCDFFLSETNPCQKSMKWKMRVDYLPPKKEEINMLENALMKNNKQYPDLTDEKKKFVLNDQIKQYSKQIYKKTSENVIVDMENIVCQRENPFYVDVVKAFRDKRYILKTKQSELKLKLKNAKESEIAAITKELIIYESLQVAHKCILNSFYGYVMRKNSRWYSMEMAAIVCNEGGRIIKEAKEFIDMIGLTLELDTDGIWCFIPEIMPTQVLNSNFLSFYLNEIIKQKFTNHVYHNKENDAYTVNSVNEIAFEIDGPYKAMIIPSSTEENKLIKKRYVIINNENKITEVKGFEIKRRGELSIVKRFQEELFKLFYQGNTLSDCYGLIKTHCLYYLNMIETKGQNLTEDDVFTLFSESKSMSKKVSEYENSKSRSINTAKRLAEILGQDILDEKGLKCEFVQSKYPFKSDIAERTLPVQVFKLNDTEKRKYLKKWTGTDLIDLKDLMDWEYYKERLSNIMLRMVVLPSISQGIEDLIPGIKIPDWAMKKTAYGDLTAFAIAKPKTDDVVYANNQESQSVVKLDNTTKYSKFIKQVRNMWINSIQDCKVIRYLMKDDDHIYYFKNNKILRKKVRNEDLIYFRCDPKSIDDIENFEKHAVIDQNGYYRIDATHADALYNSYWVTDIVYDNFRNSLDYILTNPKHNLSISYDYSKLQIIQHHMILSFQYGSHDYYIHKQADGSIKIVTENREHFADSAFTCAKITTYIAQKLSKPSIIAIFLSDKNYNTLHRELTKSMSLIVPLHDTINASFGGSIKEIIANYRKELESISLEIKSKYNLAEWFKLPLMTYLTFSYNQIYDILFLRNCKIRLARFSKPVKTSFEDFNKYYYKTCVGYYDSFVLQLKIKDLEFHCLSQNQNSINCEILNENDRELFNAIREMVKEIRTVTYKTSKDESGKNHSKCFTSKFARWLFFENHYLSETLLQFLQSCVVNYYFGLLSRITEFGAKIIMMNKSVIMIDTKKKSKESCQIFLNNLMSELGTEKQFKCIEMDIVRIMSKLAIADPVNLYFMLEDGTIRSSNQSKVFVKNYLSEFFSGAIENAYFYNLLIKRKYRNIVAINNMLDVYETKQNIDELRSSCCKMLNISEFEEKYETEYLMDITCLHCSMDNMVILTKLQVSNCASCYTSFTEEQVYNAIVSYIMDIIAKRTVICVRCSREKSDYIKELCLCGSPYKLSDLPDDLTNLKLYVKNTSHVKNVEKIFSLYVK